jgi:hypothetical protein
MRVDLTSEAAKFRDHAHANGRELADWNAGFSCWLRNVTRFGRNVRSEAKSRAERIRDAGLEALRKIEEAEAGREPRT